MRIGLIAVDGRGGFPNLALMRLSTWHKRQGDAVDWWNGFERYDRVWLAAVYLLSAHAGLWQKTIAAVTPGQIDFGSIRLGDASVREYVLYRVAKGIFSGALGATSAELADPELVNDDTLLLVLCAVLIARYGPDVMQIGGLER